MEPVRQRLATNLRQVREERGLSQEDFAHTVDVHRTYISDLERCARNPSIEVIDKIAQAMGVSMGRLLDAHTE